MARQTQAATRYRVLNPRGINPSVRILEIDGKSYFEGDEVTPPAGAPADLIEQWVTRGFIEVIDG